MKYPLSDEYMTYNYLSHRYVLTEKDVLENLGINLQQRAKNPEMINALLTQISMQVYSYIHSFNISNEWQNYVIAKTEKGREIIKQAMEQQLIYYLTVGDLTKTTDREKRAMWFDELAKETLMQPIPEIGVTVCYSGRYPFRKPLDTEW